MNRYHIALGKETEESPDTAELAKKLGKSLKDAFALPESFLKTVPLCSHQEFDIPTSFIAEAPQFPARPEYEVQELGFDAPIDLEDTNGAIDYRREAQERVYRGLCEGLRGNIEYEEIPDPAMHRTIIRGRTYIARRR